MSIKPGGEAATPPAVFSRKEFTIALNNVLAMARRPAGWEESKGIPDIRLTALGKVAESYREVTDGLIDDGDLRPEEAVYVYLGCALATQLLRVNNGTPTPPVGVVSKETLDALRALLAEKNTPGERK